MIPVCIAVVAWDEQGRVATSARRHDHTFWGLPGGKLDPEDGNQINDLQNTLLRAAQRELREETGLHVELENLVWAHGGVCVDQSGGGHPDSITITFEATEFTGELVNREGEPPAKWSEWSELTDGGAFADYNRAVYEAVLDR